MLTFGNKNASDKCIIDKIDDIVFRMLTETQKIGKIVILTAAEYEWVLKTSEKMYKKTHQLIKKIDIISREYKFEKDSPYVYNWKEEKMSKVLKDFCISTSDMDDGRLDVIGLGDNVKDRLALLLSCDKLKKCVRKCVNVKSIKFFETPKELNSIYLELKSVYS
ncbi:hypothetical protein HOK76_06940, partial [archaeon]|nr:hypothetical protein [archaeon]